MDHTGAGAGNPYGAGGMHPWPGYQHQSNVLQFSQLSQPHSHSHPHDAHIQQQQQQQPQPYQPTLEEQRIALELARETIKLRELELQIAAEKRKDREAQLALAQLHISNPAAQAQSQVQISGQGQNCQPLSTPPTLPLEYRTMTDQLMSDPAPPSLPIPLPFDPLPYDYPPQPSSHAPQQPQFRTSPSQFSTGTGASPLQITDFPYSAFEDILKELMDDPFPNLNPNQVNGNGGELVPTNSNSQLSLAGLETNAGGEMSSGSSGFTPNSGEGDPPTTSSSSLHYPSPSPPSEIQPESSTAAATNTRKNKKQLVERLATCSHCSHPIAKLLLRGTRAELDVQFTTHYLCERCAPPVPPQTSRKRMKQTEDTSLPTVCDVCLRNRGRGGIVPRSKGMALQFAVEVVCLPCTVKYKRCSDCGGGSGRLGVGKWRCKELFDEGRKTCNLSHARLGTGELELAVWEVPKDVENEVQVDQVLEACEALWRENVLRLAVPEVLDADDESVTALHTYQDIETRLLARGWPARQILLQDEIPRSGQRKFLSLTWAKNRPRRGKTSTLGARSGKIVKDDDWLFSNIRRTKVFCPAGSMLVGLWLTHWDVHRQSIHITTTCPFDPGDLEDRSVVAIAETINRIINEGSADHTISPPAHIWCSYNETSPILQTRLEEALIRKKGFFPVDEYIQRFPDVSRDNFVEPSYAIGGGRGWTSGGDLHAPLKILVKTLGRSLNWYRLQKLKMQELSIKKQDALIARKRKHDDDAGLTVPDH